MRHILPLAMLGICSFSLGCTDTSMSFEKITSPSSPAALAWISAGALAENLFPNSAQAFMTCARDAEACESAGGYSLQVTPAGRRVLDNLKVMLALKMSATFEDLNVEADPFLGDACSTFAGQLFEESDADAYETSMRLLAVLSIGESSPLDCVTRHLDTRWKAAKEKRVIDRDIAKTGAYFVAGMIAARYGEKALGLPARGFFARTGKLILVGGAGVLVFKSAEGVERTLELDRWVNQSEKRYFVGQMNWLRKYRQPSVLVARFQKRMAEFADGLVFLAP